MQRECELVSHAEMQLFGPVRSQLENNAVANSISFMLPRFTRIGGDPGGAIDRNLSTRDAVFQERVG